MLAELEEVLGIESYPMNWPIGMGKEFYGIYDRFNKRIEQFRVEDDDKYLPLDENGEVIGNHPIKESDLYTQALEEIMLLDEAGNEFSVEKISNGTLSPVFFGSALTNFGVQTFLETYLQFAPSPQPRMSNEGEIDRCVRRVFWLCF